MATLCPLCKKGTVQFGEKQVYCDGSNKVKEDGKWFNMRDCDFHIPFNQKTFGKVLMVEDIERLLEEGSLKNAKGDILELDLSSDNGFYTHIDFASCEDGKDF